MHTRVILIVFLLTLIAADSRAQFWKKKRHKNKAETQLPVRQPNALNPGMERGQPEKGAFAPKKSRKAAARAVHGPTYGLEEEFYERMEAVAKARKKAARIMEKPQYSDPMYFGHKHPPKKRKPSKMKFCKECGIRH